jgi:hypothetical protein
MAGYGTTLAYGNLSGGSDEGEKHSSGHAFIIFQHPVALFNDLTIYHPRKPHNTTSY